MALSEQISSIAKLNEKLQVEQYLFPLKLASAISLPQEDLPDTEQSHSGIVFCKFMAGAINFFIHKTYCSCQWPTLCFCCCKKYPRMAFWIQVQHGDRVTSMFATPLRVP